MNILGTGKEQRLLKLFDRGDATAMDKLYAEYADYLTGVCYRYIGNADDLKDVLQEAFIKIFTQIGTFKYRGKGSLKAWVTRIVINEALTFLRNKKRENIVDIDVGATGSEPSDEDMDSASGNDRLTLLQEDDGNGSDEVPIFDLIAKLPTGYRMVFNMFVIDGMSHKEIAEQLGITPGTSASQFHKARHLLARMIKEYRRQNE